MRSVNFDDLDDEDGTEPPVRPAAGSAAPPAASAETPATLGTAKRAPEERAAMAGTAPVEASAFGIAGDSHEALTFGPLTGDGTFMRGDEAMASLSATLVPADIDLSAAKVAPIAELPAKALPDDHDALTFHSLTGDGTGTALEPVPDSAYPPGATELPVDIPAKPARSIYEAEHALQSPSRSLADSFDTVVKNVHRLTPGQVEVLHAVLMELGADLDVDGAAGYGPEFDMTAFIQRMIKTTKAIENRLYRPGEDGMQPAFSAQELGAITNANKNLLMMIAKNHDKVMGWERQRAIEAAHMAAARDLPADIQDRYLAKLQAELEARGL